MEAKKKFFMDCHLAGRKYHDADENRIVYVWRDIVQDDARGHTCIREFHEMFDSELLRDVAFKRLVNRLERKEP